MAKTQQQIEFNQAMQVSRKLMKKIEIKLNLMKKDQAKHPGDWSYNGSAGKLNQDLQEIYDSLSSWL